MKHIERFTPEMIAKLCLGYLHIKKELYCPKNRQQAIVDCLSDSNRHCWKCLEKWLNSEVEE